MWSPSFQRKRHSLCWRKGGLLKPNWQVIKEALLALVYVSFCSRSLLPSEKCLCTITESNSSLLKMRWDKYRPFQNINKINVLFFGSFWPLVFHHVIALFSKKKALSVLTKGGLLKPNWQVIKEVPGSMKLDIAVCCASHCKQGLTGKPSSCQRGVSSSLLNKSGH